MAKLLLIDASSSIFRAFYAIPPLTTATGVRTNATLGFTTMLQKLLRESLPDYVVVVWDAPGAKRRKELYPEYKATRDATPDDLRSQFSDIRRVVHAYRLHSLEYEGEEADDVIATLVRQAEKAELEVEIASTDKDLMQLVSERVALVDTMRDRRFGPAEVEERLGVPPERVLDTRALVGDTSDNIPGVKGIGEKGAAKLINEFGSLDALLENVDRVKAKRAREALVAGAEQARLSRELSRLRDDLPLELDLERAVVGEPDGPRLAVIFRELEFKRLLEELGEAPGDAAPEVAAVETSLVREAAALSELAERLAGAPRLGLSIAFEPEDGMRGEWVSLCLAESSERAACVRVGEIGEDVVLEQLGPLFESPERSWVGHDLKLAALGLVRRGVSLAGELRDLAVAAYVDNPSQQVQRPEALCRAYLGASAPAAEDVFGKGVKRRSLDGVGAREIADFFGPLAARSLALEPRLSAELEAKGQLALYEEIEVPLVSVLAQMELAGVRVDEEHLQSLASELAGELAQIEQRIYREAGGEFNIGSPKQLQHVLFEKLALAPTKKTKTGFSTDESVLADLAAQGHELPGEMLAYRRLSKLKNTYVDALPDLIHPETGRIHTRFNQTVAATGRLSSSNPNLQNIPIRTPEGRKIREAFVPAEGRLLLSADYSQVELRILAHLSRDEGLLQAFREGVDIHVRTASQVFGIAPEEVSEEQRSRTKAINFGTIYGQGAFGLARMLGISQAEASAQIVAYFERYPGVKAYLAEAVARATQCGYAETLDGRRRYLPDLHSRNRVQRAAAQRMATNSAIQGTAADFIKRAMVRIGAALREPGAPRAVMILQVHDELLFEVVPDDVPPLRALVAEKMQTVASLDVPLEVHLGEGRNWLEAH